MKNIIKIIIYILIITLLLQRLYIRQTNNKANEIRQSVLISEIPYNCVFESSLYNFELPDCEAYKTGTIIQINAALDPNFSTLSNESDINIFEKKRLIIESIDHIQSIWSSPELWFEYIFYFSQIRARLVLIDFLSLFDANDSYLIGQLNFGFSQLRSESISHLFKVTGTQHLASISGYNLSLVVGLFTNSASNFLGKRSVGVFSLIVSSLYLLLVGNKLPLVRAFLMLFFGVIATSFLLRQSNPSNALFLTVILLLLSDISVISSISFQLSFVATASIIYFTNQFSHFKNFKTNSLASLHLNEISNDNELSKHGHTANTISVIKKYILDSIKISIYVQSIITPLVIFHFMEFSIISLLVSIALTWLVTAIILLSFISIFFYLLELNDVFLRLIVLPLGFLSKVFIAILNLFDNQLFLVKVSYFPWWYVLVWWLTVILIVQFITRKKHILHLAEAI